MRDAFARVLEQEMEQNERIVLITGDLGFGVLRRIHERFPDRLINAGIAEQSMVSVAAGLASTGRTVLVYSIGNFPVLRPLEQIRNDCAYHGADVKVVCVGGGFVYGSLGMSHHATEDMAIMRAIPGITCYTPGDPAETETVTRDMLRRKGTCYLRLGRGGEPAVHEGPLKDWAFPEAITLREGSDIAILSAGGILTQAVDAAERLAAKGISARVVSFPCLKPLDADTVKELLNTFRKIVTVEEHTVVGGFGSAVCELAAETGSGCRVKRIGLEDCFTAVVGDRQYLREVYGMDGKAIAEKAEAFLKE
ncbi:MAG: transketolase [Clostridiales bacterium]|nr:transketolase [Clostridia bacterium]MCR5565224.1 transketolase [Clostridiales bacterium]